ncbi:MAG: hypothetical protein ACK8QZ_12620, partial [Anaerolineales bacterium]
TLARRSSMYLPHTSGVFLQRIETADDVKIIIKLSRIDADSTANTTDLTLHINEKENSFKLNYDPWSDINVIPDGSIDERDLKAITDLAIAFYRQTTIDPQLAVFLSPIDNHPGVLRVRIGLLELDEGELSPLGYFFTASSVDDGVSFKIFRVTHHGGSHPEDDTDLESMTKAFIKMKV